MSLSLLLENCLLLGHFSRVSTLSIGFISRKQPVSCNYARQFARRYFTWTRKDVWCPPFFVKMLGLNFFVFNELKAQASLLNSLLSNVSEVLKICCRRRKGSSLMISRASKDWKECFSTFSNHFREMVFGSFILILFFLRMCTLVICNRKTCWKTARFLFSPQLGAMIQFDDFF